MKHIIILMISVVAMLSSTSCATAQPQRTHYLPARGYNDPYSYSWSSGRSGVNRQWEPRTGRGYCEPRHQVAYVARDILRGLIVLDRIFSPYCSEQYYDAFFDSHAPNRWVYGRHGMPYWPVRYMNNEPFYWYPTPAGSIAYYTSTNVMLGVSLDDQILLIREQDRLYVWDTRGRLLQRVNLYAGLHTHFEMQTRSGFRLVEIFYDGACRVNLVSPNGAIEESYELY